MITIGWLKGDHGVVLYRDEFAANGLEPGADRLAKHRIWHESHGLMESCRGCTALINHPNAIVFWAHPLMFTSPAGEETQLCAACRRAWSES